MDCKHITVALKHFQFKGCDDSLTSIASFPIHSLLDNACNKGNRRRRKRQGTVDTGICSGNPSWEQPKEDGEDVDDDDDDDDYYEEEKKKKKLQEHLTATKNDEALH